MAMNLIACENCGVVLDANVLKFPKLANLGEHEDGATIWDSDRGEHVPCVPCPVCDSPVLKPE